MKKFLKLLLIFVLIMSIIGKGVIGVPLKDTFYFLLGNTYYWMIVLLIVLIITTFMKKKYKKSVHKILLECLLFFGSLELIISLIKSNALLGEGFIALQATIDKGNIQDGIGLVQAIIVSAIVTLFGKSGLIIISTMLIIICLFFLLDFDIVVKKLIRKSKKRNKKEKSKKRDNNTLKEKKSNEKPQKKDDSVSEEKKRKTKNSKKAKAAKKINEKKKTKSKKNKENISKVESKEKKISRETLPWEATYSNLKGNSKEKNDYSLEAEEVVSDIKIPIDDELIKKEAVKNIEEDVKVEEASNEIEETVTESTKGTGYIIPSINLLNDEDKNDETYKVLKKEAEDKKIKLEKALVSYKLRAKINNIIVGPSVTKFELRPEPGQKASRFSSLADDLTMALEAISIRIEAPIPGKGLVGIEIPNSKKMTVNLKKIIKAKKVKSVLEVALGEDITGEAKFIDISKTPHMLVAGATGSGKSVCINTIITSILLNATPDEIKFLLVDPKKVELTPYEGIPHLVAPVITDPSKAAVALHKLVLEMEKRYELFTNTKTRNIESYNEKVETEEKIPYIVAIIDELADLMMVASNEIETSIARIAQKARAAGIHMILATQRPSTDVITGLIKSNIPTRLSFMVSSSIDSRTILDSKGAEQLLGYGDMLLSRSDSNKFERIQGAYLSDEEIEKVVSKIAEQFSEDEISKNYDEEFTTLEEVVTSDTQSEGGTRDLLQEQAIEIGIQYNKISTSLLQRKLRIGYNRAATIMEDLEDQGLLTPNEGNKARKIIMEKIENDET